MGRGVAERLHPRLELRDRLLLQRVRLPLALGLEEDRKRVRSTDVRSIYAQDNVQKRTYPTAAALITLFSTPPLDDTCGPIFHRFATLGAKSSGMGSGGGFFLRLVRFCVLGEDSSSPSPAASDLTLSRFRFVGRGLSSESGERELREEAAAVMTALRAACLVVEAMVVVILELLLRAMTEIRERVDGVCSQRALRRREGVTIRHGELPLT